MALIKDSDIQVHLPIDKLALEDLEDDLVQVKLDVERMIKGQLSGTFSPVTLASWSAPDATPEMIRLIGGRLAAALIYRLRLAQDFPDDSDYALLKYNEGMSMLAGIVEGSLTIPDIEIVDTGSHLSVKHFVELPEPKFTMDMEL